MSTLPNTLADIRTKVRRITGRPSPNQIADSDIDKYINTFYVYDLPEHLRLISLRVVFNFITRPNIQVYDLPDNMYLTGMPPVFIAGYQSYATQSREDFFRINPQLNFLQQQWQTGNGTSGPYSGSLTQTPIIAGYQQNPPGAYNFTVVSGIKQANSIAQDINWNVLISANGTPDPVSGFPTALSLIDDGFGNLIDLNDPAIPPTSFPVVRGSVNYITGAVSINSTGFAAGIVPSGAPINAQYTPYVATRPLSALFYQQQFLLYPIPDQEYEVNFEAYQYPTAFLASDTAGTETPQINEWWQLLAYGAADKIFADNGDLENLQKFRPLLEEQMTLVQRRTIVQQTSDRVATIYTEQTGPFAQWPFGNLFSGF